MLKIVWMYHVVILNVLDNGIYNILTTCECCNYNNYNMKKSQHRFFYNTVTTLDLYCEFENGNLWGCKKIFHMTCCIFLTHVVIHFKMLRALDMSVEQKMVLGAIFLGLIGVPKGVTPHSWFPVIVVMKGNVTLDFI